MKIKVTAGELSTMAEPLRDLMSAKMPAGVGYHVARLVNILFKEISIAVAKQRDIMQRYKAEANEEGDLILSRANPNFGKAEAELNDLFAQTIVLDVDMVEIPEKTTLEPATLLILNRFVKVA